MTNYYLVSILLLLYFATNFSYIILPQ